MRFYTKLLILIYILTFSQVTFAKIISADNLIIPTGFTFLKSLVYRSTLAPDTKYLQNLLNMNTETEIKIDRWDNSGSNANLTDSFGGRTKSALERFHVFYNQKIQDEVKKANPNATTTFTPDSKILDFYTRGVMNDLVIKYQKERDGKNATTTSTTTSTTQDSSNSSVLAALAALGASSLLGGSGNAASGIMPFGGKSTSMVPCTCSGNILLYVLDARGTTLPLIYQPGVTVLYKMGNPTSGTNMLGQYVSGGQCLIYVGSGCSSGGTPIGTMIQLGTSLSSAGF